MSSGIVKTCQQNKKLKLLILLHIGLSFFQPIYGQRSFKPFPQHVEYYKGCIKPNHVSQRTLDNTVTSFYYQWKNRFVKTVPGKQERYIWFEGVGKKQCVSEGQGYGMIITALMAGADPESKGIYDDLYRYYQSHHDKRSKYLMAWAQFTNGESDDVTSATDGDLDIAYSLLLANKQWGSKGTINYINAAKNMLAAIMKYEVNPTTYSILLCDGIEAESKDYYATRSSDFMPSHFKAFKGVTNDKRWEKVINANYKLFNQMQVRYSPDAGLIPDFIVDLSTKAKPAPAKFLESIYDGQYNYNACRVPWRIATDLILNGDNRSKALIDKINKWVRETTKNTPYNLSAGYTLTGNDIKGRYFEALSFIAPFAVAAMTDKNNQQWLNNIWDYLIDFKLKDYDYYDNTIKLLDMIIISGNYWDIRP